MLNGKPARLESLQRIRFQPQVRLLSKDWSMIDKVIQQVNSNTGNSDTIGKRILIS